MDVELSAAGAAGVATRVSVLLRDATYILYLWNSGRRGQSALYVDWEDLYLQGTDRTVVAVRDAWAGELVHSNVPIGCLLMVPCRSKTEQYRRPQAQEIARHENSELCAIRRLRLLYQWQRARTRRQPVGSVFRPQRPGTPRLSSQAAGSRVKANLVRFGVGDVNN